MGKGLERNALKGTEVGRGEAMRKTRARAGARASASLGAEGAREYRCDMRASSACLGKWQRFISTLFHEY